MKPLAAVLVCVAVVACSSNAITSKLRIPSDEGVVTAVSVLKITLDGKRTFAINRDVESFTASSHTVTALRAWKGRYVHVGLDSGRRIKWVAGLAIAPRGDHPTIFYTGKFGQYNGDYIVMQDGTAQRLARGVRPKLSTGDGVLVLIDPKVHRAVDVHRQSS